MSITVLEQNGINGIWTTKREFTMEERLAQSALGKVPSYIEFVSAQARLGAKIKSNSDALPRKIQRALSEAETRQTKIEEIVSKHDAVIHYTKVRLDWVQLHSDELELAQKGTLDKETSEKLDAEILKITNDIKLAEDDAWILYADVLDVLEDERVQFEEQAKGIGTSSEERSTERVERYRDNLAEISAELQKSHLTGAEFKRDLLYFLAVDYKALEATDAMSAQSQVDRFFSTLDRNQAYQAWVEGAAITSCLTKITDIYEAGNASSVTDGQDDQTRNQTAKIQTLTPVPQMDSSTPQTTQ